MNTILLDSGCRGIAPEPERIRSLLGECEVLCLEPAALPRVEEHSRAVLLTSFPSGVMRYHRDLLAQNPQIRSWVISIVGVTALAEQRQLERNLEAVLSTLKVSYTLLFDDPATLAETAKQCAKPVKERQQCLIVSRDGELGPQFRAVFSRLLPTFDVVWGGEHPESHYEDADVFVAVGRESGDFQLPAPDHALGRVWLWLEEDRYSTGEKCREMESVLRAAHWDVGQTMSTYSGSLNHELAAAELAQGQSTIHALAHAPEFLMWDRYGLPLSVEDYTEENIRAFLDERCMLQRLAEEITE